MCSTAAGLLSGAQSENRMDLALRLQLTGSIPLVPASEWSSQTHEPTSIIVSSKLRSSILVAFSSALIALVGVGCKSLSGPASASFASVIIHNHSADEIRGTTAQVFREAGYAGGSAGPTQMVFNKEASRMTTISRDGLVAAQEGAQTIERVRAELVDLGGNSYRLQCQAYLVSGGSDPFFQDEVALTHVRSGPYRSLLNKVASQLK